MMKLPEDKQAALEFIEQLNHAVATCLKQNNLSSLQETYEIRNRLIETFFERFVDDLTQQDMNYFSQLKVYDDNMLKAMQAEKSKVLSESASHKKFRDGIRSYNRVANKS